MALIIIDHARQRMAERGVSEEDVRVVLATETATEEDLGRRSKESVFAFESMPGAALSAEAC